MLTCEVVLTREGSLTLAFRVASDWLGWLAGPEDWQDSAAASGSSVIESWEEQSQFSTLYCTMPD